MFVEFYSWYEHQGEIFIAMEFVPFGDLEQYIRRGLREDDTKQIGYQVLEGICVMHRLDYVHRDIKPSVSFPRSC